ncbi:MAG: hypothetical protein NTU66_04330 [Elusimicrobia bacterium]|nr:hypothetical protein [Elusimicrobiota bacterium]
MAQKIIVRFMAVVLCLTAAVAAEAGNIGHTVYGLWSETYAGIIFGDVRYSSTTATDGYLGAWNCFVSTITPGAEGQYALELDTYGQNGGIFMQFGYNGTDTSPQVPTDMSAYAGGTLQFMAKIYTECGVKIEWTGGSKELLMNAKLGVAMDNQWHQVSVPLSWFTGINLSAITCPADFYSQWLASPPLTRTLYIDNVFWQKANPSYTLNATIKNTLTHAATTQITWSNVNLGSTKWKAADQYIELNLDCYMPNWGIQIYTDNTNTLTGANPLYVGGGNPAGLVGYSTMTVTASSQTLPMCWRITDSTITVPSIQQGAPSYPDRLWDANTSTTTSIAKAYPCFFWLKDQKTPDNPLTVGINEAFSNSDDYVTVWSSGGIHHAEGANWGGGCYSPNYIYLGANFSNGLTPRTYKTNELTLELFND